MRVGGATSSSPANTIGDCHRRGRGRPRSTARADNRMPAMFLQLDGGECSSSDSGSKPKLLSHPRLPPLDGARQPGGEPLPELAVSFDHLRQRNHRRQRAESLGVREIQVHARGRCVTESAGVGGRFRRFRGCHTSRTVPHIARPSDPARCVGSTSRHHRHPWTCDAATLV